MVSQSNPVIAWFRTDLRLSDHQALTAAADSGRPLVACYVLDEDDESHRAAGSASRWWLHHSLAALSRSLEARGGRLVLRRGKAVRVITELAEEIGALEVHCSAGVEPGDRRDEPELCDLLSEHDVALHCHDGVTLLHPNAVMSKAGNPFKVFTPYWRTCLQFPDSGPPLPVPERISFFAGEVASDLLGDLRLLPTDPNWAEKFGEWWAPGEEGATSRLRDFMARHLSNYPEDRDRPDRGATSRLSPHLHFGELSPRQVWHAVRGHSAARSSDQNGAESYLRELGWREFSHYLLYHWPTLPAEPFRPEFAAFPWTNDIALLRDWQRGKTGYPLVDAGMRELWQTGWMHNRVRMVVASFLVKHLLIDWRDGAAWFWDTLVDADLANNSASWQWVAGSGADAAPYFRIFNPVLQGQKFDPDGVYVRRWVPEVAKVPTRYVHEPWAAPESVLDEAGIVLGRDYPYPIVDHREARERALAAYRNMKRVTS